MKRVILTPNPYRDKGFHTVRTAMDILRRSGMDVRVCLPFDVDRSFELPRDIHFHRLDRELDSTELVICFGGDGTILHTAKAATRHGVPILGVNIGTMGFMAELESSEMEQLTRLAKDDYSIESRMMLDVSVTHDSQTVFNDICLNDVAITKGAVARIITASIKCDGIQAMECGGDGVIISTPTGSTAYNLSAGGPIVEPGARNILITPICAHDVGSRCLVTSDQREITVELVHNARRNGFLSVDGGKTLRMSMGDVATIRKSAYETKMLRLQGHSFYDVVNMKFRNSKEALR